MLRAVTDDANELTTNRTFTTLHLQPRNGSQLSERFVTPLRHHFDTRLRHALRDCGFVTWGVVDWDPSVPPGNFDAL